MDSRHILSAIVICILLYSMSGIPIHAETETSVSVISVVPETLSLRPDLSELEPVPAPDPGDAVVIIVENSIYSSVSSAVIQYRQDLNDTGYYTILYTQPISTAEELKSNLTSWYETEDIVGAVLIGRLPYAEYHHPGGDVFSAETFICDLFLMDLDGAWYDGNPSDGIYDSHAALPGTDIWPEIFVARIDPTCLTWGPDVAGHINAYLNRTHEYRIGQHERARRGLMYVDNDWTGYWGSRWADDMGLLYSTRTVVQYPLPATNATDWLTSRLPQDYQWGHLCAHSSPTAHYFGSGGSEGIATSAQIRAVPPAFNFYNLFCCSGAEWTTTNNLGVTYLFSGPNSMAVIGSTKTGSMMDCDAFYGPLSENLTLGQSLSDWFYEALRTSSSAENLFLEWYYGMNIIGDPFLTTYYDCTVLTPEVFSPSHPDSSIWYQDNTPTLNWTTPPDVNNITGYYYVIDHEPSMRPTPASATFTTNNSLTIDSSLSDGVWYFHIVATDSLNNTSNQAAHFRIRIDTAGPITTIAGPGPLENCSSGTVEVTWEVEDGAGYARAEVFVDGTLVYNGSSLSTEVTLLAEGAHGVSVTAYDILGFHSSSEVVVFNVDLGNPVLTLEDVPTTVAPGTPFTVTWSVQDTGSGYRRAYVYLEGDYVATVSSPETELTIDGLEQGSYTLRIVVYDWSGRSSSQEAVIAVQTNLIPLVLAVGGAGVLIVLLVNWKRR